MADFLVKEDSDKALVSLARRQCQAIESFGNSRDQGNLSFTPYTSSTDNMKKFIGCMPVSFQRHNFDTVQTGDYYVSEKTDGVRYLLAFVEDRGERKAVLLDRNMQGWRPKQPPGEELALSKVGTYSRSSQPFIYSNPCRSFRSIFSPGPCSTARLSSTGSSRSPSSSFSTCSALGTAPWSGSPSRGGSSSCKMRPSCHPRAGRQCPSSLTGG